MGGGGGGVEHSKPSVHLYASYLPPKCLKLDPLLVFILYHNFKRKHEKYDN